jgi:4-amino-4-deoxy-L-arabinose transferase-like glycosyltransferase
VVAAVAVFLFTFLPPVLGHAGLATNDMALTALLGAAFVTGWQWLEDPTWKRALCFGLCSGLMVLAKFSCLVFFPVVVALILAPSWRAARALGARLPTLALAVAAACLIIWAGYRFSFGMEPNAGVRLPAPALFTGLHDQWQHNEGGHPSYLLGERSFTGFWCYFEIALAYKTPLAFLILLGSGAVVAFRAPRRFPRLPLPLVFASAFLLVGLISRITIGVRHILPVYIGFAIVAAAAVVRGLETAEHRRWRQAALATLVAWLAASSLLAHPDYLPYFNELAGGQPEKILVDSDLDWGQDIKRAARRLHELGAREVTYEPLFLADLEKEHGFPPVRPMDLLRPSPGWNLVSFTLWKQAQFRLIHVKGGSAFRPWPDRYPPGERVGKSMMLWYAPYPGETRGRSTPAGPLGGAPWR